MSQLTKNQLGTENSNSFPNNNTGYITPTLLRTFNQNMIDSLVDEDSYTIDSGSVNAQIDALQAFSTSLDASFVSETQFGAYTASQTAESASFNSRINALDPSGSAQALTALEQATSSLNAFTASQYVSNSLFIQSSQTSSMSVATASFALNTQNIYTGSLENTSSFNSYTASAASGVSASINAATQSLSASLTLTDNSKLNTGSFNSYTQSIASQIAGIGQAIAGKLNTASISLTQNITGSVVMSGSSAGNPELLRLDGGVGVGALALHVISGSVEVTTPQGTGHFYTNLPITSSNGRINGYLIAKNLIVSGTGTGTPADTSGSVWVEGYVAANVISSSTYISASDLYLTGLVKATSASFQYVETIFETASTIYSSGSNQFGDASNDTQTLYGSVNAVNRFTASGLNYPTADNGEFSFIQTDGNGNLSLQYVNTTNDTVYNGEATTLVKGTPVYVSGSQGANPKVFRADAADVNKMPVTYIIGDDIPTAETGRAIILGQIDGINTTGFAEGVEIYAAEGGGFTDSRPSGSTSIVQLLGIVTKEGSGGKGLVLNPGPATLPNLQTGYVWVGNTSNQPVAIATSSLVVSINTGSFATTASNTFIGNQIISGNLLVSGANINLEVDAPALSVGVTNVKTLLDATASGVVTTEDIYRTGAGPTGDLSGIRLQTLSGSDTSGDTLLSRVSTGVNRHTSTAMTGSVVNTIIQSAWATGSAGGRVSYASNVILNAQSASSTLTLNAGNSAANFGGGTASLVAGRINIGTTNATIISTGSTWSHNGQFATSQGITANNGGITATSGSINGEFRVNGSINITGSNPTIQSGSLSGSLVSTLTDTYASTPQATFIVTIDSASMATLLSGAGTNANTLYFVI